jgi:hypothetical protein
MIVDHHDLSGAGPDAPAGGPAAFGQARAGEVPKLILQNVDPVPWITVEVPVWCRV